MMVGTLKFELMIIGIMIAMSFMLDRLGLFVAIAAVFRDFMLEHVL